MAQKLGWLDQVVLWIATRWPQQSPILFRTEGYEKEYGVEEGDESTLTQQEVGHAAIEQSAGKYVTIIVDGKKMEDCYFAGAIATRNCVSNYEEIVDKVKEHHKVLWNSKHYLVVG